MIKLKKTGMRCLKIAHLLTFCCWLGGAMAMVMLNLYNHAAIKEGMLYGMNMSSHLIDIWIVVAFGAMGCLFTGLVFGLFTVWGFFKHKWIIVKWALTILCILSGTFFLGEYEETMLDLSGRLGNAALDDPAYLTTKAKHLYMSLAQICALFFMLCVSVFKPWGGKKR